MEFIFDDQTIAWLKRLGVLILFILIFVPLMQRRFFWFFEKKEQKKRMRK